MITFNVGPSKVYPQIQQYLQDAYLQNVISISHRSPEFIEISRKALARCREKLDIPSDFTILYVSSATESWEIISQDLVAAYSAHFYNGEFGRKWFEYAKYIRPQSEGFVYNEQEMLCVSDYKVQNNPELLAFTLNETSTGTQVSHSVIEEAKRLFPEALIAIDTTSCLAGVHIPIANFDVVFGSVQKCFGMPAGLGLLILSPRCVAKAQKLGIRGRYNSLLQMIDQIKNYQTNYTPNVLGIYLLSRVMEQMPHISQTHALVKQRAKSWYSFIPSVEGLHLHITNPGVQSDTVITVGASDVKIQHIKNSAKTAGIELGAGYGPLKNSTFRIANFPAITEEEISHLKLFLQSL